MKSGKERQHPFNGRLSLYVSGDLPWREHLEIRWHLTTCGRCREVASQLAGIRKGLRRQKDVMPTGTEWENLAAEIKANIHLGLDAGAIVAAPPVEVETPDAVAEPVGWRLGVVFASLVLVALSGWYLHRIQRPVPLVASLPVLEGIVMSAGSEGVEVASRGSALTVLTPAQSVNVRMDAEAGSSVRARYVDSESGQVTITHVYADAE